MRKLICGLGGCLLYAVLLSIFVSGTLGDPTEICQPRNVSYNIADSQQCDKYHQCTKGGKLLLDRLCDDGFVFSEEIHACEYPHNVNCSSRPALQPSKSINPDCPRMNGFYPFPPAESCQKFYHCLEGKAYEKSCAEGVIFDPSKGTCIHPDLSKRPDCAARSVLNFTCPNYGKKFVKLRFGDHDRLPHSTNCRKFFICLSDGKPRIGGCPLGKVFNPKLGVCDSPKAVPQCKDYYGKKDLAKLAKLAELGEEGSLEDDEIDNVADEEEEAPSSKGDQEQEQEESQPPPQPEKSKSKGKKFQSHITINKRQEPLVEPAAKPENANDNSSSSDQATVQNRPPPKNSTNKSNKNNKMTDTEDDDDEDDED